MMFKEEEEEEEERQGNKAKPRPACAWESKKIK
jgi:hypothetical protein